MDPVPMHVEPNGMPWFRPAPGRAIRWHFWHEMKAGRRPKLVLGAPPQHGKSDLMRDFCCWAAGKDHGKILFASYADELGIGANLHLQRTHSRNSFGIRPGAG